MEGQKLETIAQHERALGGQWLKPLNNYLVEHHSMTNKRCANFYMDYLHCTSRVGIQNSATLCKEQFEDLQECRFETKRNARIAFIQRERIRQSRPGIEPLPTFAQKSGDSAENTENMLHGPK